MDNITSGITTVQNISKFWDYAIPALLFMVAGVLQILFLNKKKPELEAESELSARLLKGLPFGFVAAYCIYVLGASLGLPEVALSISLLAFAAAVTYLVARMKTEMPAVVQLCAALCALNLKIFTTQGNLLILVLLNAVALLLILGRKVEFLLAIVSIIIFKKFDFGPYVVNDLFHSSEFVVSYQRGLNALGEWNVFPNIGFLEEAIPNFIIDAVAACSGGYFQISIQDAYSLCLIFLTGSMYYFLEKKWKGVAYALTMLIAVERLTLMLVINLGLGLSTLRNNSYAWAVVGLSPLLLLGLSPSYGAVLVLSLALFFLKNKPTFKLVIPALLIGLVCVALSTDTLVYFLKVYKDWGAVNSAAHGTAMWSAPTFKTVLRLAFVFSLSLLLWQMMEHDVLNVHGCIALIGIGVGLWMYLSYGFTRLDKDTASRIFPVGLAIFVSLIPYLNRYTKAIPAILFISFFGASFATPQPIGKLDMFRQSPKMTLDADSQASLEQYKSVVQKLDGEVILFGGAPTLANYMTNAKIPPFSSPWVAIGQLPQEYVIDFFKNNPNLPILLGENFSTWDHVDVRARAPLIYQYLAQRYRQVMINDVIVAIPSNETTSSEIFSGFDIGSGAAYYEKSKNQVKVTVPCERDDVADRFYKVSNEKNYFYAKLKCGVNGIPEVYFSGEHLNVSKRQVH